MDLSIEKSFAHMPWPLDLYRFESSMIIISDVFKMHKLKINIY